MGHPIREKSGSIDLVMDSNGFGIKRLVMFCWVSEGYLFPAYLGHLAPSHHESPVVKAPASDVRMYAQCVHGAILWRLKAEICRFGVKMQDQSK